MSKCIPWCGYIGTNGYGRVDRATLAHRAEWEAKHGGIPKDYLVHHECGNRACVNVEHMRLMTNREHGLMHAAERSPTHCKHGHEFTVANTYRDSRGWRQCRMCNKLRRRRYRARAA